MRIYCIASGNKFWQAPNGDIVYVDRHTSWGYRGKEYQYGRDDITGWNRGMIDGGKILVNYPNPDQVSNLKDLADSRGLVVVYYDSSNRERELYNPNTD